MKRPAYLIVLTLIATLLFSSVAFADPLEDETLRPEASNAAIQSGQAIPADDTAVDLASAAEDQPAPATSQPATGTQLTTADVQQPRTPAISKTSIASAKVSASGMIRNVVAGKQIRPSVVVKLGNTTLTEGKDYRLKYGSSYAVPTTAGTYVIYAEALDTSAYSGSVKVGEFKLYATSLKANTAYEIASQANSAYVLDASGAKPRVGSNVTIWSRNNGTNQKWYFTLASDGYYIIKNAANQSLVLDASGKSPRRGANVSVWSSNGGANQRWIIEQSGSTFLIHSAADFSFVLDASGKAPRRGANVSVWSSNGGANQKWYIRSIEDVYAELDSLAAKNASAVSNGTYTIFASGLSGYPVLDVKGSATNDGANVQTASSNSSQSQLWEISHAGNYVLVKNKRSGKYLSVSSSNSLPGANVIQSSNANARASKWIFVRSSDGSYSVRSALYTGIALDITGGKSAAGTNVETWSVNSGAAQKFGLVSASVSVAASSSGAVDTSSYYLIKSSRNTGLALDVTAASSANGANIELWNTSRVPWQTFRFEAVGNYYRIVAAHAGKVLTIANNSLVPGANVIDQASSSADNQLWQVRKNADGTYSFVNKRTGFALQAASSTQKAGTNVNTSWNSTANANQKFTLERLSYLMPTGIMNLKSALNASQVLDVASASTADNAKIETWASNNGQNQKWNIQPVSGKNNTYTLQSLCSGKYLADNGSGTLIQTSSPSATTAQWSAAISGTGYSIANIATNRALDVTNSKAASGTLVSAKARTWAANQRWSVSGTAPLANGTYIIRSKVDSAKVFDVVGNSMSNNANIDMWSYNAGGNQKFNFTRNSDGTYTITNCMSGKALDAAKAASSAGTNIAQYAPNGQKNQRWRLVYNSDHSFKLVSAVNSQVVIAFNGSTPSNGTNVCLVKDTGANAQRFMLEKTTAAPVITGDAAFDKRIYDLAKAQGSLRACFNWVKAHKHTNWAASSSATMRFPNGIFAVTTPWVVTEAKRMFDGKTTDCYDFACAFAVLAKASGYNATVVTGHVPSRSVGWASHAWVEINKNGTTYVYDTDLARSYPSVNFYEFTYGKAPITYHRAS